MCEILVWSSSVVKSIKPKNIHFLINNKNNNIKFKCLQFKKGILNLDMFPLNLYLTQNWITSSTRHRRNKFPEVSPSFTFEKLTHKRKQSIIKQSTRKTWIFHSFIIIQSFKFSVVNRSCHKANPSISYLISNRLSITVGGNREMD